MRQTSNVFALKKEKKDWYFTKRKINATNLARFSSNRRQIKAKYESVEVSIFKNKILSWILYIGIYMMIPKIIIIKCQQEVPYFSNPLFIYHSIKDICGYNFLVSIFHAIRSAGSFLHLLSKGSSAI